MFQLEYKNEKYYVFEEDSSENCHMRILDEQTGLRVKKIEMKVTITRKTLFEASSLDRIKMTKNWLEFDQKIFTAMNLFFNLTNS